MPSLAWNVAKPSSSYPSVIWGSTGLIPVHTGPSTASRGPSRLPLAQQLSGAGRLSKERGHGRRRHGIAKGKRTMVMQHLSRKQRFYLKRLKSQVQQHPPNRSGSAKRRPRKPPARPDQKRKADACPVPLGRAAWDCGDCGLFTCGWRTLELSSS
jgi:hypothetical protein